MKGVLESKLIQGVFEGRESTGCAGKLKSGMWKKKRNQGFLLGF